MKRNRTVFRAIEILNYVASHHGVELNEICQVFDLPKTSAYDILETLVETELLEVNNTGKKHYVLALGAFRLGAKYLEHFSLEEAFEAPMKALANRCDRTAFFAIPENLEVVYLIKIEPSNPILTLGRVGGSNPMYCTALGKVMLAHFPPDEADRILSETNFVARTSFTHTTAQAVAQEFDTIRAQGYGVDYRELEDHGLCIAAPVFSGKGDIYGAVSVSGLFRPQDDISALGKEVGETAAKLTEICRSVKR